ncbi:MAG: hypothetical protein ACI920_003354, partial [Saprospiraceae bacterium]
FGYKISKQALSLFVSRSLLRNAPKYNNLGAFSLQLIAKNQSLLQSLHDSD